MLPTRYNFASFLGVVSVLSVEGLLAANPIITFNKDIAPILFEHCASCHRPGGGAPFNLLTYDNARQRAALMAQVTRRRYMPPWKPEAGFGDFVGERRLTGAEIALFEQWVESGSPEGEPGDLPAVPRWPAGDWQLGAPDLVIAMPEAYELASDGR